MFGPSKLPPSPTLMPALFKIEAKRATTVLLPLEPVTPIIGALTAFEKISISPRTGIPNSFARCISGVLILKPGLTINSLAPSSELSFNFPTSISISGKCVLNSSIIGGLDLVSINSKGKPLAEKYFATDNPVLPNPIMMLFRPKSEFFKVLPNDSYRSFNVARPKRTSITVIIQNRTITLGSGQPFNSK